MGRIGEERAAVGMHQNGVRAVRHEHDPVDLDQVTRRPARRGRGAGQRERHAQTVAVGRAGHDHVEQRRAGEHPALQLEHGGADRGVVEQAGIAELGGQRLRRSGVQQLPGGGQ
jgi:hypothetical protein